MSADFLSFNAFLDKPGLLHQKMTFFPQKSGSKVKLGPPGLKKTAGKCSIMKTQRQPSPFKTFKTHFC
jgi:hypothetical protein